MAQFEELRIRNFLTWRRLDLPLDNRGLLFVFGDNGTGKSAIPAALEWCLYGKVGRGVRSDDVVNNRLAGDCSVTVTFTGDDGHRYELSRYRKHGRFGDNVVLRKEDKDVTCATVPATQHRIESVLQLSRMGFRNSVLFDPNSSEFFSSCTDAEQKRILKEVLDLEVFSQCYGAARDQQITAREKLTKYDREIEKLFKDKKTLQRRTDRLHREEEERSDNKERQLDELEGKRARLKAQSGKKLRQDIEDSRKEVEVLRASQEKRTRRYTAAKIELRHLQHLIDQRSKLAGQTCPECGQDVPESFNRVTRRNQIAAANVLRKEVLHLAHTRFRCAEEIQAAEDRLLSLEKEKSRVGSAIASIDTQIAELRDAKSNLKSILADDQRDISRLTSSMHKRRLWVSKYARLEALADFWVRGFGIYGIELYVLKQALPHLNYRIQLYLSQLPTHKGLIKQHFTIDSHNGKMQQEIKFKGGTSYQALSTGERARVDLADQLALHDLVTSRSSTFNVLFLDEVFKGFDERGIDGAVALLESLKKHSMFVISHEQRLKEQFTNVLHVKQDKRGFSYIC